jgi:Uri superfamily endonuclease
MFEIIIYRLTNTIDNLTYIGSTTEALKTRLSKHKSRSRTYQNKLYRHCNWVEWHNIQIEEIFKREVYSHEEAREYEQFYIDLLKPALNTNRAIKMI